MGNILFRNGNKTPNKYPSEGDFTQNNFIVQLFTGLKDKNGKEIYAGDIVKVNKHIGEVFNRLGCWYVSMLRELGYLEDVEIIGNIFENPDLLKK